MKLLLGCLLSLCAAVAGAADLRLLTDDHPPLQFVRQGQLVGYGVDLVHDLAQRTGDGLQLEQLPLRRALLLAEQTPDTGAFLVLRTRDRESRYQWVGPALEVQIGLYSLGGRIAALDSLEQARHAGRIAVPRKWVTYGYLQQQGLDNLYGVESPEQMMNLLKLGHVDMVVADDHTIAPLARDAGIDPSELHLNMPLLRQGVYIAFSVHTDAQRVARWQEALQRMQRDGELLRLAQKWQVDRELR